MWEGIDIQNNTDLSNQKFGLLTVVSLDDIKNKKIKPDQINHRYWVCKCECGNITSVRQDKLIYGKTKSCGCFRKDKWTKEQDEQLISDYKNNVKVEDTAKKIGRTVSAVKNRIVTLKLSSIYKRSNQIDPNDIIGQKYGKLTVISILNEKEKQNNTISYICNCDCGKNNVIVTRKNLLNGRVKSCGCLVKENMSMIAKKEPLEYINHENKYYECILSDESSVYFDYEDYDIVHKYRWMKDANGYICAITDSHDRTIFLHRLIMSRYFNIDNLQIDHIHGKETRNDNRKCNLRVVTISQNRMNVGIKKNNKSGVTGVSWSNYYNVWVARITKYGKTYCLGNFVNFDDAVLARKRAEDIYFGEYSFANSQAINIDDLGCNNEVFTGIIRRNGK